MQNFHMLLCSGLEKVWLKITERQSKWTESSKRHNPQAEANEGYNSPFANRPSHSEGDSSQHHLHSRKADLQSESKAHETWWRVKKLQQ